MAMTPKEQLEILTDYLAGKEIQYQSICGGRWVNVFSINDHSFNFESFVYRIKPKPLEWWCNVNESGKTDGYPYISLGHARQYRSTDERTVHMREVLGD